VSANLGLLFAVLASTSHTAAAQTNCSSSDDCLDGEYCAAGECLGIGNCTVTSDCFNPSNSPYPALACVGYMSCTSGQCGMTCGVEECEGGEDPVDCDPENLPCDVETCAEAAGCYNDRCGGSCSAVFYDAAGNIVCQETETLPEPVNPVAIPCTTDADCYGSDIEFSEVEMVPSAFCAQGTCLEMSYCQDVSDCYNPSNIYSSVACVGFLVCADGQCGRDCSSACEDGSEEVQCVANPCETVDEDLCPDVVSCVSNYCNGCNTFLFDAAGFQVESCANETETTTAAASPCTSDDDCEDMEYCAAGSCLDVGSCNELVDCFNPANGPYALAACVGYRICEEGSCGITCDVSFCPDGQDEVECPSPGPCNTTTCDEAVSCYEDRCGGECSAVFFDAAGSQVCNDDAVALSLEGTPCSSSEDCVTTASGKSATASEYYCAQGICKAAGTCEELLDCFNPNNIYGVPFCVGYMDCGPEGFCSMNCGAQECVGGEPRTDCDPDNLPCDNESCPEAADGGGCYNDGCGGACTAVFYDAAGNIVCQSQEPEVMSTTTTMDDSDGAFQTLSFFNIAAVLSACMLLVHFM